MKLLRVVAYIFLISASLLLSAHGDEDHLDAVEMPEEDYEDDVAVSEEGEEGDYRESACVEIALGKDFTQEEAPQDISLIEQMVFHRVNENVENISRISISYTGSDIRGVAVGPRRVKSTITHGDLDECLVVTFNVLDTDECTTTSKAWMHKCDSTAKCLNTIGSYECSCSDEEGFGTRGSGRPHRKASFLSSGVETPGLCWGHRDTLECCHVPDVFRHCDVDACLDHCKSDFRCTTDACSAASCAPHASCFPTGKAHEEMWGQSVDTGGFECVCDPGYEDDGEGGCKLAQIPDWCANNECPCNCACVPDAKRRGYTCKPEPGYKKYDNGSSPDGQMKEGSLRLDSGECIHASIPTLSLVGDNPYRIRQGDDYVELGAEIVDNNLEKTRERRMIVSFVDKPLGHCVSEIGEYRVKYELDIDWLNPDNNGNSTKEVPSSIKAVTRTVVVEDVDECTYTGKHPRFYHRCANASVCVNTIGSYECKCPDGYEGDGLKDAVGCVDVRPPTLACAGAGCHPKLFRAADIHGLISDDRQYVEVNISDFGWINDKLSKIFEDGKASGLDLFCETTATVEEPCFTAYDDIVVDGLPIRVNLTPKITMSSLELPTHVEHEAAPFRVNVTTLRFKVIYSVADAANNTAYAQREIRITALSNDMFAQFARESIAFVLTSMLKLIILFGIVAFVWLLHAPIISFASIFPFVVGLLVLPSSIFYKMVTRKQYIAAVDFWLKISRLGMLDEHQRLTIALQEWSAAQTQALQ